MLAAQSQIRRIAISLLAISLIGSACKPLRSSSKPRINPGRYTKSIEEGDLKRTYILRVPPQYDNKTRLPLVVLFHGWSSNAKEAEVDTGFGAKSGKAGFILAIPDGTPGIGDNKGWNAGFLNLGQANVDDVKFTNDLLDEVEKDLLVDNDRVYIAGHSNGAMMAYDIAANLSDRIAGIAVVSGTIGIPSGRVRDPNGPVSAIIFHGKADPTVPYDSTISGLIAATPAPESAKWWAQKDGCGPAMETKRADGGVVIDDYPNGKGNSEVELVTIVKGTHAWPSRQVHATDMIWEFFKAHPKTASPQKSAADSLPIRSVR